MRKLGPWSEFSFLYRFTVLLNSGGSNSPWSKFWSEFPHFMGMGVGRGRSTVGKCAGPKWPKRGPFRSVLVEMTLFRTGFWHSRDQNGPIWPEEVHLGPFRSANRALAIPEPLTAEEIAVIRIAAISSC